MRVELFEKIYFCFELNVEILLSGKALAIYSLRVLMEWEWAFLVICRYVALNEECDRVAEEKGLASGDYLFPGRGIREE